jgi:hypothetical protein
MAEKKLREESKDEDRIENLVSFLQPRGFQQSLDNETPDEIYFLSMGVAA